MYTLVSIGCVFCVKILGFIEFPCVSKDVGQFLYMLTKDKCNGSDVRLHNVLAFINSYYRIMKKLELTNIQLLMALFIGFCAHVYLYHVILTYQ